MTTALNVGIGRTRGNERPVVWGNPVEHGTLGTEEKFTGQRLDDIGLYFYNARYYDPAIGRFISADSVVPDDKNPQALNRCSYVFNNPLGYTDPSGNWPKWGQFFRGMGKAVISTLWGATKLVVNPEARAEMVAETALAVADPNGAYVARQSRAA